MRKAEEFITLCTTWLTGFVLLMLGFAASALPAYAAYRTAVLDRHGKCIIAPEFERIRYIGNDRYLCCRFDKTAEVWTIKGVRDFSIELPVGPALSDFKLETAPSSPDPTGKWVRFSQNRGRFPPQTGTRFAYENYIDKFPELKTRYLLVRYVLPGRYCALYDPRSLEKPEHFEHLVIDDNGRRIFAISNDFMILDNATEHIVTQPFRGASASENNPDKLVVIYDKDGKITFQDKCGRITSIVSGLMAVDATPSGVGIRRTGVLAEDGTWIQPVQSVDFEICPNGTILKRFYDERFNKKIWSSGFSDRMNQFHNLLLEQNLIGMKEKTLIEFLGDGSKVVDASGTKTLEYCVVQGGICGGGPVAALEITHGVVSRWQLKKPPVWAGDPSESRASVPLSPWFTENVIFDRDSRQFKPKK